MEKQKTIIIIVGPTAVGKTGFAVETAKLFNTCIISADSRQCYKEMNIGVARPSDEELKSVQHYFINSHSIHDNVNAVVFEEYAMQAAQQIFSSNDFAVMAGGTGLYVKAFVEGMDDIPAIDEAIRKNINSAYRQNGLEWLQNEVQEKDPVFWQNAEQQNPQRLMRALEIKLATGKSINAFRKGASRQRNFNIIKVGLELPREDLYNRINNRVDTMIEHGLIEEAKALLPYQQLNALQTVGYKELFNYFEGGTSLEKAIEDIKRNTRHYAKRQLTWFKKDPEVKWFSAGDKASNVINKLLNDLM